MSFAGRPEPSRYQVDSNRLTCLGLWGISIGRNKVGLIEACVGDLGRDLPSAERAHWLSFNEAPSGGLDEDRFRRDILGQRHDGPPNPLRSLATARQRFSTALARVVGQEIYRPWDAADKIAFDGLHMPSSSERQETDNQILTLAKGVIDYLDVKAIRNLPGADPKGTTINCIEAWVKKLDEDPVPLISPLRLLQGLRSTGVARARSKDWQATLVRAGLDTLQPDEQFVKVVGSSRESAEAPLSVTGPARPNRAGCVGVTVDAPVIWVAGSRVSRLSISRCCTGMLSFLPISLCVAEVRPSGRAGACWFPWGRARGGTGGGFTFPWRASRSALCALVYSGGYPSRLLCHISFVRVTWVIEPVGRPSLSGGARNRSVRRPSMRDGPRHHLFRMAAMGAPVEDLDLTSRPCQVAAGAGVAAPGLCKGAVRESSAHK
ncbi:hypothetical protein [Streptomyces sp. NPDC088137]|uniref:hypothetical protein n=1 Tax=Streptomyces sp. NPDC088137 TaxID=3365827 RepID=UPI00381482D4